MKFRNHKMAPAELQLAPMLDVVFQLLIFFLVSFEFQRSEMDMKVSVPSAQEGDPDKKRALGEIIVNVRKSGEVVVEHQTMTQEQLKEKLTAIAALHENQPIRLRGDAECTYQTIVEVIDTCQKAGIWNISFATQRKSEK